MIELYFLLAFVIVAAVIAVENHDLLSSAISVGAVGLGLCIIFLILGAPELAMTQLVVEILALVVLIRGTIAKSVPEIYKGRELSAYFIFGLFALIFAGATFFVFRGLPHFGFPLVKENFSFGPMETVGVVAVAFAAVTAVTAILRGKK